MNNLLTNYTTILNRARKKYNIDMIKYENKKRAYWKKNYCNKIFKKNCLLGWIWWYELEYNKKLNPVYTVRWKKILAIGSTVI